MARQAIADPDDLTRFAHDLYAFNAQLRDSLSRLQGQFGRLGDTWRDQEHAKFGQEFEITVRQLHTFMKAADEHAPFLLRKADRIRDYLSQR